MHKLIYKPKLVNAHEHTWHYRERQGFGDQIIQGYICKCGKRDYIDMVSGIASKHVVVESGK